MAAESTDSGACAAAKTVVRMQRRRTTDRRTMENLSPGMILGFVPAVRPIQEGGRLLRSLTPDRQRVAPGVSGNPHLAIQARHISRDVVQLSGRREVYWQQSAQPDVLAHRRLHLPAEAHQLIVGSLSTPRLLRAVTEQYRAGHHCQQINIAGPMPEHSGDPQDGPPSS